MVLSGLLSPDIYGPGIVRPGIAFWLQSRMGDFWGAGVMAVDTQMIFLGGGVEGQFSGK